MLCLRLETFHGNNASTYPKHFILTQKLEMEKERNSAGQIQSRPLQSSKTCLVSPCVKA